MKNKWKTLLAIGAAALLLTACSKTTKNKDVINIGILQYMEHKSLDAARKGFENKLAKEGYKNGQNIHISYENAQGDQANLQSISEKLVTNNKLVLGIATPAAQSLVAASTKTPILFSAICDPVGAKLIKSMDKASDLVTGVQDTSPNSTKEQIKLLKKVMPKAQTVGILYTPTERNSEIQVEKAQKEFKKMGVKMITKSISSTNDIQDTAKSLMKQVDVVFVPSDNTIASAISLLAELSKETKIPVIGGSADMVKEGLLCSYGADYEKLGEQAAKMAIKIIKGEDVSTISPEYPKSLSIIVNKNMAKSLDIDVSSISDK